MHDCNCECHNDNKILEKVSIQRQIFDIVDRLNEINNWRKGIKILADQSAKPFKCPVCGGLGAWIRPDDKCKSCEGKGIVWR